MFVIVQIYHLYFSYLLVTEVKNLQELKFNCRLHNHNIANLYNLRKLMHHF